MRGFIIKQILLLFPMYLFSQEVQWEKTVGGDKSEYLHDMQATPDYGFILAGSSLSGNTGNKEISLNGNLDYFIWKMDENGNQEWQKSFGGSGIDNLYSIEMTKEGGYILGGSSDSPKSGDKTQGNFGLQDYWIIKLNPLGKEEWQLSLGGKGTDILLSAKPTKDGGYILGGSSNSKKEECEEIKNCKSEDNIGNMDFWIVKLNSKGNIEWQRTIGGKHYDILKDIQETSEGKYILGGDTNSQISGDRIGETNGGLDFWIVQLSQDGNIEWQKTIGGDKKDELQSIIITSDNGFLLGGISDSNLSNAKKSKNKNGTDWWIVKIDHNGNIEWDKTYDISVEDILIDVTAASEHEFLLSGYARKNAEIKDQRGIEDYVVIKIDDQGEEKWRKIIGGKGSDRLEKTIMSRDGGYILSGTSNSESNKNKTAKNNGREDYWIVKLKDLEKDKKDIRPLELYPNPAREYINILVNKNFTTANMEIFDMSGVLIKTKEIKRRLTPINIMTLPTGSYIIKVNTNTQSFNAKFLKL